MASQLVHAGVLEHETPFLAGVWLNGASRRLKAGEYLFPANISPQGVMDLLLSGKTVVRRLTVPEGLTTAQIFDLVRAAEGLEGALPPPPAEGSLLPETWHYSWGDERAPLVERMHRAMAEALAELWPKRIENLPLKTPEEALVLASIVEKETGLAAERPMVAAVFLNRLRHGMKLQSDPTVAYGVSPAQPLDRALTRADLDSFTRWNTYRIDGLPPTPIANPGRASLLAVLQPAKVDYLYFVADGTGGHAFAKSLDAHNRNVATWRKLQQGAK